MTTATTFETTANIITATSADGRNGPQWALTVHFPWTNVEKRYVDYVYLEQSQFPTEPAKGVHNVEVSFRSLKNKLEGGKHSGTHYWMNNYYITRIGGAANQMSPLPDLHSIIPGMENTAAANSDTFTGNTGGAPTPTANGNNGGHYDPSAPYNLYTDRNYGQIKGNCNNILMALESKLPDMWDDDGNPNFAMWVYWRDEIYNNFQAVDITVYAEGNAEPVAEEPVPAAPVVKEHYCEKHGVDYGPSTVPGHLVHQVTGSFSNGTTVAVCHEGADGIYDNQGNPVEAIL
jgi:hypothetical protein